MMSLIHIIVLLIPYALPYSFHHVLSLLLSKIKLLLTPLSLLTIKITLLHLHFPKMILPLRLLKMVLLLPILSLLKIKRNYALMLSKDPCQDQSLSSSCSTTPCSLPLSTLPNSLQASNNPIKEGAPIQDVHDPIENPNAHSKDVDVLGFHIHADELIDYPFVSSMSILGPPPPILRFSHFPSILGPYVPSLSPPNSPNSSSILGPYVPPSPIFPQDQHRCIPLNPFHPSTHLNQSYSSSSSTSPKSFGRNLNVQYKKKKKYLNPSKKQDHHVSFNRNGGIKSKEISKKKTTRQVWVPKSIIEDILSKSSKRNEKSKKKKG